MWAHTGGESLSQHAMNKSGSRYPQSRSVVWPLCVTLWTSLSQVIKSSVLALKVFCSLSPLPPAHQFCAMSRVYVIYSVH